MLADMGFTPAQARKALRESVSFRHTRRPRTELISSRVILNERSNGSSAILAMRARKQLLRPQSRLLVLLQTLEALRLFLPTIALKPLYHTRVRPSTLGTTSPRFDSRSEIWRRRARMSGCCSTTKRLPKRRLEVGMRCVPLRTYMYMKEYRRGRYIAPASQSVVKNSACRRRMSRLAR